MGIMTYLPKLREGWGCHLGHYSRNMSPHRVLPSIRDSGARLEYQLRNADGEPSVYTESMVCCVQPACTEH